MSRYFFPILVLLSSILTASPCLADSPDRKFSRPYSHEAATSILIPSEALLLNRSDGGLLLNADQEGQGLPFMVQSSSRTQRPDDKPRKPRDSAIPEQDLMFVLKVSQDEDLRHSFAQIMKLKVNHIIMPDIRQLPISGGSSEPVSLASGATENGGNKDDSTGQDERHINDENAGNESTAGDGGAGDDEDDSKKTENSAKLLQLQYRCNHCGYKGTLKQQGRHFAMMHPEKSGIKLETLDSAEAVADAMLAVFKKKLSEFEPTEEHPNFVLLLPTGNTPKPFYEKLMEAVNAGDVNLENVVFMNMDEYLGASPDSTDSYQHYMHEHVINRIKGFKEYHLYNGSNNPEEEIAARKAFMRKHGYFDLVIAGVGSEGHIAFNEKWSLVHSETRVVNLRESTIRDNARHLSDPSNPYTQAITVGMAEIMRAETVYVLATGRAKQAAVTRGIDMNNVSIESVLSLLNLHSDAHLLVDQEAAPTRQSAM